MTMQSENTAEAETGLSEGTVRMLSNAKNEPEWLLQLRLEALRQFEALPLPQLSYGLHVGATLNINMKELKPSEFITNHQLNHQLLQSSEADGVVIEDLSVAATKYENILKPLLIDTSVFQNKLEALHSAFWNNGVFVYAPKNNQETARRIQLTLEQKQTDIVHIVVYADEGVNLDVIESLNSAKTSAEGQEKQNKTQNREYRVEVVDVIAKTGSKVKYAAVQKLSQNVQSAIAMRAAVESRAEVDWIDISIGGLNTKREIVSMLNGEGATSSTSGAFFGDNSQQLDLMAKAVHNARHTTSNIRIKGALKGSSKAIVQSFTKIMAKASNSEGHQKANILLLSETARASPIPKLEIDNYDVKASHEASVGQLDKDKLFYLMSRGLNEKQAARLVVEGFFEPLIKGIELKGVELKELADELRHIISTKSE